MMIGENSAKRQPDKRTSKHTVNTSQPTITGLTNIF